MSTVELLERGMKCLRDGLGDIDSEEFISIIIRERFDYTKWRRFFLRRNDFLDHRPLSCKESMFARFEMSRAHAPDDGGFSMSKNKDVTLTEVNESNFLEALSLRVAERQRSFVADAAGILARGYVFRGDRARVYAMQVQNALVGLLLVRDLKDEPACYDLQQLMIDARHQNRGYGTSTLEQLLSSLKQEHAFDMVEVCVKKMTQPLCMCMKRQDLSTAAILRGHTGQFESDVFPVRRGERYEQLQLD